MDGPLLHTYSVLFFTKTLGLKEIFAQRVGSHQLLWWSSKRAIFFLLKNLPLFIFHNHLHNINSSEKEFNIVYIWNTTFTEYPALEQVLSLLLKYVEGTDLALEWNLEENYQNLNKNSTLQTKGHTFVKCGVFARHWARQFTYIIFSFLVSIHSKLQETFYRWNKLCPKRLTTLKYHTENIKRLQVG